MTCLTDDTLTGSSIGRYFIRHLIGAGGMGRVYFARDERTGNDVAIKVLDRASGTGPARGLTSEARMLSRLSHPNVAGLFELVHDRGMEFLVMEFVPGPTLRQLLGDGPLPLDEVVRLGTQLARGLAAIHRARIVHCDIKPENLKVTPSGDLKILDFGVAKALPYASIDLSTTSHEVGLVGTMAYMSPEQLRGETADERSDVYSAGAVLYEMACGRPAFAQRQIACLIDAILHDDPADIACPSVPAAVAELIAQTLRKDPGARPQSARELAIDLARIAGRRGASAYRSANVGWAARLIAISAHRVRERRTTRQALHTSRWP